MVINGGDKNYILIEGYHRLEACKKLGWKTIPSFLNKKALLNVPIKEIEIRTNTRRGINKHHILTLMQSIKDLGLKQPIEITDDKEILEEDYLIESIVSNLLKLKLNPYALAISIQRLKDLGLSNSEIAIRLSKPRSQIENVLRVMKHIPETEGKGIVFGAGANLKRGSVPLENARIIYSARIGITDEEKATLFKIARREELSVRQLQNIVKMLSYGVPLKDAIKAKDDYFVYNLCIPINKALFDKHLKKKPRLREYIRNTLTNKKIKPIKGLVYKI